MKILRCIQLAFCAALLSLGAQALPLPTSSPAVAGIKSKASTFANFQSVNANGWSVTYASPPTFAPDTSPETFAVSRQGWDAAGAVTTVTDNLTLTKRIRQPYPNQATLTSNQVSVSNYIYSTDTVAGVTNNSTELSPAPVMNWAQCDRQLIGNTLDAEVTAWHRNARAGKPVACVIFTATDGTLSVSQTVSTPTISTNTGDRHPVIVYRCSLNISTLAPGQITLNAKGFGIIGGASATNDSATNGTAAGSREFCPQIYWKDVALLAARPRLYLDTAGNDTTGYVGTNDSLAAASPCATLSGCLARAKVVLGTGLCDGLTIFMRAGTFELTSTTAAGNLAANHEIILTRDPAVSKAAAIYGFGTGNFSHRIPWLRLLDISVKRTGTFYIASSVAPSKTVFQNVDFDNSGWNVALASAATSSFYFNGATIINGAATLMSATTPEIRLVRGVTYGVGGSVVSVEGWNVLGCDLTSCTLVRGARLQSGGIQAFTGLWKVTDSDAVRWGSNTDCVGAVFAQNVVEYVSATGAPAFSPSRDGETGNITHLIAWNNTFIGANVAGRGNILYDDGPNGNLRTHKLHSFAGNIHAQINVKADWFAGVNAGLADASQHVGNWAYVHGVGCRGEFAMYQSAGAGVPQFGQEYPGLRASIGTSSSVRNDPLFTDYRGTTYNGTTYTAGAGGGTYALQPGSPCIGMVSSAVLPFNFAGAARPATNDNAGAY